MDDIAAFREADSLQSRVTTLAQGDTVAVAKRISRAATEAYSLPEVTDMLRNKLRKPASRATAANGAEYTIETGIVNTRSGDIIVSAFCTRIS